MKTSLQDEDEDDDDDRAARLRCEGLVRRRCLARTVSHIVNKKQTTNENKTLTKQHHLEAPGGIRPPVGDVGKLGLSEKVRSGRIS